MLRREKLSSQVYAILRDRIADYRFEPGARLNVEQLAKELGVSRTPVWEAVARLQQEGLVRNEPNRGVFVQELTPETAREFYEVRLLLEAHAARLAVQNLSEDGLGRLRKCVEAQREVVEAGDLVAYSRLDFEFHSLVYEAAGNRVLRDMLEAIKSKMRGVTVRIRPILDRLYQDHQRILEALEARDADAAEIAFREHNEKMLAQIDEETREGQWRSPYRREDGKGVSSQP